MALKEWFSVQELAGMPGMPSSEFGVIKRLKKNLAINRPKVQGKGLEYALKSLPDETRAHIAAQVVASVLACLPESLQRDCPATAGLLKLPNCAISQTAAPTSRAIALKSSPPAELASTPEQPSSFYQTNAQRAIADARQTVLRFVARLEAESGHSTRQAMLTFLTTATAGRLTGDIGAAVLALSRDSRGRKASNAHSNAAGLPTLRTLQGWLHRAAELAPGHNLAPHLPQATNIMETWMVLALELKRRPQKPTTTQVLELMRASWPEYSMSWVQKHRAARLGKACTPEQLSTLAAQLCFPSYDQVSRFFRVKFSAGELLQGQHLGSALREHQFYQHRTNAGLEPFVEVHADGWNTHFLAPHPINGEYVSYEVWHFHDVATRYTTPFSIGMSESADVIMKGLENCIRVGGVPAIWQTDSTGSVKNARVEFDPVGSLSARAGLTVVHPQTVGNSQANGIAENYNTRLDRESRALATYMHPERMDSLAFKQVRKFTGAMVKAAEKGDAEAHRIARAAAIRVGKGLLFESQAQMVSWLDEQRVKSNNTPHSALKKMTDASGKVRHQTPQEALDAAIKNGWIPVAMDEATLVELFRMHDRRTVRRETVTTFNEQRYYHADLLAYNKQEVIVASDTMDGERVWVKTLDGALICEALFVAATGYRAQSTYEWALAKRMTAQIKRKERQIDAIRGRMDPDRAPLEVRAIEVSAALVLPMGQTDAEQAHERALIKLADIQALNAAPAPTAPAPQDWATRTYGAAAEQAELDRLARLASPVESSWEERFAAHQQAKAECAAQDASTQPVVETYEDIQMRLLEEADAREEERRKAK